MRNEAQRNDDPLLLVVGRQELEMKCDSCKKGFNGMNGMGYQPCSCPPPTTENIPSEPQNPFAIDIIRGIAIAVFLLTLAIIYCSA